jgi:predicted HTH transcriptional regulator
VGDDMQNIFQKNFDQLVGSDITNLIDTKYKERQGMEYKREMYGRNDSDKKELLRDISSIANAYGGYLIVGIETDDEEIPNRTVGVVDAENERNRIEQLCLASIEPRIPGLKTRVIRLNTGEDIIIVIIPRSIRKPHMITHTGLNQFWIGTMTKSALCQWKKYEMHV